MNGPFALGSYVKLLDGPYAGRLAVVTKLCDADDPPGADLKIRFVDRGPDVGSSFHVTAPMVALVDHATTQPLTD